MSIHQQRLKQNLIICCTSANAVKVVESLGADKVIFFTGSIHGKIRTIKNKGSNYIVDWNLYSARKILVHKKLKISKNKNPEIVVLTHPECPPEVIAASDFTGSTSGMSRYVKEKQPKKVMLVTECSMSDNVQVDNPNVQFIKPCNLCPYMKNN